MAGALGEAAHPRPARGSNRSRGGLERSRQRRGPGKETSAECPVQNGRLRALARSSPA